MIRKAIFQLVVVTGFVALCTMFAGSANAAPSSQHVTVSGYISCTTCLLPNTCKAQTRMSCVQWWVSQGASYVLVAGNEHYRLSGAEKDLAKYAGASVTVTGDLSENELVVATVEPSHKEK